MTHSTYTFFPDSSAAVKQIKLNGAGVAVSRTRVESPPGNHTFVTLSRIDFGHTTGFQITGDGGADPVAGDVLLVGVVSDNTSGQVISPPSGSWNTLTPTLGAGSVPALLSVFWIVAAAGDITGSLTFTSANSAHMTAYCMALPQAYIDNTNPVLGEAGAVSSGDVASIDGPTTTGPGTPRFSVFELVVSAYGVATDARDDGAIKFMDPGNNGTSGSGTIPGILGYRYYFDVLRGWNAGLGVQPRARGWTVTA